MKSNLILIIVGMIFSVSWVAEAKLTAYCSDLASRTPTYKMNKRSTNAIQALIDSENAAKDDSAAGITKDRSEERNLVIFTDFNSDEELRNLADEFNIGKADQDHVVIEGRKEEVRKDGLVNQTRTLYLANFTFDQIEPDGSIVEIGGKDRLRQYLKYDKTTGKYVVTDEDPIVFWEKKIDDRSNGKENVTRKYRLPMPLSQANILNDHEFYRKHRNDYFNAVRRISRNIKSHLAEWVPNQDLRISIASVDKMLSTITAWHSQHAGEDISPNEQFYILNRRKGVTIIIPAARDPITNKVLAEPLRFQATNDEGIIYLDKNSMKVIAQFDNNEVMSETKTDLGYEDPNLGQLALYPGLAVWLQYKALLNAHQIPEYKKNMGKNSARKSATPK